MKKATLRGGKASSRMATKAKESAIKAAAAGSGKKGRRREKTLVVGTGGRTVAGAMKEMAVGGGCPNCGGDLKFLYEEKDIPHFGRVLLNTFVCGCGYRHADIFAMEEHEPSAYEFRIEKAEDLDVKVVRSSSCLVKVPELGIEISPGSDSEGFITNAEGILIRCEDVLVDLLKGLKGEKKKKAESILKRIRRAREGKFRLTIVFEDRSGNSAILSPKAKRSAFKQG